MPVVLNKTKSMLVAREDRFSARTTLSRKKDIFRELGPFCFIQRTQKVCNQIGIEIWENVVLSKTDITMTTINKKLRNW